MVVEHVTAATLGVLVVYDEHESRSSIKPDMSRFLLRYSKARVRVGVCNLEQPRSEDGEQSYGNRHEIQHGRSITGSRCFVAAGVLTAGM